MSGKFKSFAATALFLGLWGPVARAQSAPPAILQIEIENWVLYVEDNPDTTKWATNPNITPATSPKNFFSQTGIADIVAINGQPVKGTMIRQTRYSSLSTAPSPGQGIGDIARAGVATDYFEILKTDGSPIGTIVVTGLAPGAAAPGAPLAVTQGNFVVVGGTGAFLGVQGQNGQNANPQVLTVRGASVVEDPANRRRNGGGGRVKWVMHLLPPSRPEIVATPGGPAITHASDFSLVTAAKPATAGETLSLFVTGLGPTKPGVDPGSPFPVSPLAAVTSPVSVTVNGEEAEVLAAVGYPGAVNGYQVNFRLPAGAARGTATIQLSSAWIPGAPVKVAIQ